MINKAKTVLLSCANKNKLNIFWKGLQEQSYKAFASDGTYKFLKTSNLIDRVEHSSVLTSFTELLGGKVKTMHPRIFAGILGNPNSPKDRLDLEKYNISPISIVCVNLYPIEYVLDKYFINSAVDGDVKCIEALNGLYISDNNSFDFSSVNPITILSGF